MSIEEDQTKPYEPLDIEFVFTEAVGSVRPDFKFVKTFAEANEIVLKMEEEIKESLSKTVPQLMKDVINEGKESDEGLTTIDEDREEDDENKQDEDEENEEYPEQEDYEEYSSYKPDTNKRPSWTWMGGDSEETGPSVEAKNLSLKDSLKDSLNMEQNQDSEVEEGVLMQPKISKPDLSKEDDEFIKAFDSLLAENVAVRF